MQVDFKTYESDGTTPVETYTDVIGIKANEEMNNRGLTFTINAIGGMGPMSNTIWDDDTNVDTDIGNYAKIEVDSTVRHVSSITTKPKDFSDIDPYEDRISLNGVSPLDVANGLHYTLKENDGGTVSTNIQTVYTDMFLANQFSGKNQDNVKGITEESIITYSAGNNTLSSLNIDVSYNGDNIVSSVKEIVDMDNGNKDRTSNEDVIYYVKPDYSIHTKEREDDTSPIGTFDIGSLPFRVDSSEDLDDYKVEIGGYDTIINKVIINDTVITSNYYSSQIAASQTAYGVRELVINNDDIAMAQTSRWMDGWILRTLNPTTTYRLKLSKLTYGMTPWFSTNPDGYIKITKDDGGSTVATVPFRSATYSLDDSGFDINIVCGDIRPVIDSKRLILRQTVAPQPAQDKSPPTVTMLRSRPAPRKRQPDRVVDDVDIVCRAIDNVTLQEDLTVKFYYAERSGAAWGSESLLGGNGVGVWVAPGDPEVDQGYFELSASDSNTSTQGEYRFGASPTNLGVGEWFYIKAKAWDGANLVGEDTIEYMFGTDPLVITTKIESYDQSATPNAFSITPEIVHENEAGTDGFSLDVRLNDDDIEASDFDVRYYNVGGSSYTAVPMTKYFSGTGEIVFKSTSLIDLPAEGEICAIVIKITDKYGNIYDETRWVEKGKKSAGMHLVTTLSDYDTSSPWSRGNIQERISLPQFADGIQFATNYSLEKDETVEIKYTIIKISNIVGDTYSPGIVATVAATDGGSGNFYKKYDINGDDAETDWIWDKGVYSVTTYIRRRKTLYLKDGTTSDEWIDPVINPPSTGNIVGEPIQFEIIIEPRDKTIADTTTLAEANETELEDNASLGGERLDYDGGGEELRLRPFNTSEGNAVDSGGPGYFYTLNGESGTPTWNRVAASDVIGTNNFKFEINQDDSSETKTYLVFNNNSGANKAALRFDSGGGTVDVTSTFNEGSPDASGWTSLEQAAANKISAIFSGDTYELKVDSADGSLSFKDTTTPLTLFTMSAGGLMTIYNHILPDTTSVNDLGSSSLYWRFGYIDTLKTTDVNESGDDWRIEWDGTNSIAIPHNIAIGFKDG
jgi:hypothetical protein